MEISDEEDEDSNESKTSKRMGGIRIERDANMTEESLESARVVENDGLEDVLMGMEQKTFTTTVAREDECSGLREAATCGQMEAMVRTSVGEACRRNSKY